jgi:hypothetical protein
MLSSWSGGIHDGKKECRTWHWFLVERKLVGSDKEKGVGVE